MNGVGGTATSSGTTAGSVPELGLRGVSVRFGGVQALDGVNLTVAGGRIHGLIGPNGAGKTTLFNVATGLVAPTSGEVFLNGSEITRARPHVRSRRGLARTFQRVELCGTLTVRENVQLAVEARRRSGGGGGEDRGTSPRSVADRLLGDLGILGIADEPADAVPIGFARLVEIARALATGPSILLLDEPSSGLNHTETADLGAVLQRVAGGGTGILLVEHDMNLVMDVSDELTVLDAGVVISAGEPATVRADPQVQEAYLGTPASPAGEGEPCRQAAAGASGSASTGAAARSAAEAPMVEGAGGDGADPFALRLQDVHASYGRIEVLHGVSLNVRRGTVFALLGPNGAGKSTLLRLCSGRMAPTKGTIEVNGNPTSRRRTASALAREGVCVIPEGRAVFPNLSVAENIWMVTYRSSALRRREIEERAFSAFPRLGARRRQLAGTLSGGEQQMLALARALVTGPDILLIDELSLGLAPLVVEDLYQSVAELTSRHGLTVVLVEQYAEAALSLASEAAVLVNGEIVNRGAPDEVAREVQRAYLGV